MQQDYLQVKRGMVFVYNIDPEVDKFNVPKLTLGNGELVDDHLQYGWRRFLVVSNDISNSHNATCNIVPITTQEDTKDIPTHVRFTYKDLQLTVLCEHIYTVNTPELFKYSYSVSDRVMKKVDRALSVQLGIECPVCDAESLSEIEYLIQGIIEKKVRELDKPKVDITDTVGRICKSLESYFDGEEETPKPTITEEYVEPTATPKKPIRRKTQIEKWNERYPDTATTHPGKRRKWTLESMQEFMDDANRLSPEDMVRNYSFKNIQDYQKAKYYVTKKLGEIRLKGI